jgi:beta-ureidopropionase / N-carbamoyl-L-amino-acid hydrolase
MASATCSPPDPAPICRSRPVMTGSHIDTVRTGGRFDGNLGVLAGLEVVETLIQHGSRPHAVSRSRSSPTRKAPASRPTCSAASCTWAAWRSRTRSTSGRSTTVPVRRRARTHRLRGPAPRARASFPHAYVELHIEQGPILEAAGVTIGVVEGVQGISWTELTLTGQSATPAPRRCASVTIRCYVAARIAAFARELAAELGGDQVATVGRVDVHPNLVNVVPATVTLTVDLRNTDEEELQRRSGASGEPSTSSRRPKGSPPAAGCWRGSNRSSSTRHGRSGRARRHDLGLLDPHAERVPATTPRCSPGSVRPR